MGLRGGRGLPRHAISRTTVCPISIYIKGGAGGVSYPSARSGFTEKLLLPMPGVHGFCTFAEILGPRVPWCVIGEPQVSLGLIFFFFFSERLYRKLVILMISLMGFGVGGDDEIDDYRVR